MSAIIQASPLEKLSREPLPTGDSCVLVIFGASGDLTKRKLIPGLYNLACEGCMNPEFEVLGIGRTPMSSEEFRKKTGEAAAKSKDTRDFSESGWADFEHRLHYMVGDINDPNFYSQLRVRLEQMEKNGSSPNHLFYVSTPASDKGTPLRATAEESKTGLRIARCPGVAAVELSQPTSRYRCHGQSSADQF